MPTWLVTLLPVVSALVGVIIANRASARRDTIARLWQKRTETYVEILSWSFAVDKGIADENGQLHEGLEPQEFDALKMPDQLLAHIWAFASEPVRYAQGPCRNMLFLLSQGADTKPGEDGFSPYEEYGRDLRSSLFRLRNVIREELSSGSLRIPITFRIRQRAFSFKRKVRQLRARRKRSVVQASASLLASGGDLRLQDGRRRMVEVVIRAHAKSMSA